MRCWPLLGVLIAGCSAVGDDPRASFLRTTLVDDNRPWLDRDPEQVAGKLALMAASDYDFFRGTAGQYWRDVTEPGGPVDASTGFGDGPSSLVWLIGDPHVENVGTFRATDGTMRVDWNDLDGAAAGPWWDDLRRLALSLWIALDESDADVDALVRDAVQGYADELAALAVGDAPTHLRETDGAVVAELIDHARADGDEAETLAENTEVVDGRRRLLHVDDLARIDAAERTRVVAAVAAWRTTTRQDVDVDEAEVLDVARRFGAGIASYALLRYDVLLAGPSDDPDDDWLIELRECGDGVRVPALPRFPDVGAPSNAERVIAAQRALGEDGRDDRFLGWGDVAPQSFKVRERTGYQRGLDVEELAAAAPEDQRVFAAQLGHLLGRAHGDAPTAAGRRGVDVIAPLIAGREAALIDETARFAAAYAAVVHADADLLDAMIAAEGPLLGARP